MESDVPTSDNDQRRVYSPLVRRLAEEFEVDLEAIRGTGPGGRVTRADVQQAAFGPNLDHDHRQSLTADADPDPDDVNADDSTGDATEPGRSAAPPNVDRPTETNRAGTEAPGTATDATAIIDGDVAGTDTPATAGPAAVTAAADTSPTTDPLVGTGPTPGPGVTETPAAATAAMPQLLSTDSGAGSAAGFSLFADIDAGPLLRAQHRLSEARHQPVPLAALVVRLLAPALAAAPELNATRTGDYRPAPGIAVALSVVADEHTVTLADVGNASLSELADRIADPPVEAGPEATIAMVHLADTGIHAAAPALWADTAATIAIGQPRDEVRLVDGAVRPGISMTVGLACADAVDPVVAARFLSDLTANLEDPILVFAD